MRNNYCVVLSGQERFIEVVNISRKVVENDERDVKGNYYLALGYLECGDIEESRKVLMKVYEDNMSNKKYIELKD